MTFARLKSLVKSFSRSEHGNLTMILALAAVPLVGIAGLAIDMARITEARQGVKQVADGSALAGAITKGSVENRKTAALAYITANGPKLYGLSLTPDVQVSGKNVSVKIATVVNGTLLTVLFNKMDALTGSVVSQASPALPSVAFDVSSSAFAETGNSGNRCLIALNSTMADAIYFRGTSSFTADNCEVHANSSNSSALHLQGNANATASRFTTVGNWTQTGGAGSFSKTPEGSMASVSDPFNLSVTDPGGTAVAADIKAKDGNVSLSATKYSDISLKAGGTATFTPGIHYITGTLSIAANSTVNANGVTLVLLGNTAKIDMGSGAVLKIQAPTTGTFAGFAVVGSSSATTVQVNTIQGGAATYLRGAWYTPKHKFYVTGNGDFNQNSEYFPIVADNIEFGGNGYAHIGFDASAYGYQQPTQLHYQKPSSARLTN